MHATESTERPAASSKVLLIDDDTLVLRSLARALQGSSVETVTSCDPSEAMQLVGATDFDAILCDIQMPAMSGLAFARYVRAQSPDVPVLLMTGDPRLESALEAIELGIFEYLPKPIDPLKLRSTVQRAVTLRRLARLQREASAVLARGDAGGKTLEQLDAALNRALATLWVAYQPIVIYEGRKLFGYEALLRSGEPELPNPPAVIEAAERLGRAAEVGRAVRKNLVEAMAQAPDDTVFFLNILPLDLLDDDLYDATSPIGKFAGRVILEMTERADLAKVKDVLPRVQRLRAMGFRIAVDDLGAGYAGLSSFAVLEPEFTKLDMSLVRGAGSSPVKQRVVGSMVGLCRDLGSRVVAEGIETAEDRDVLSKLGCELMQGYFFAKPGKPFPDVRWDG